MHRTIRVGIIASIGAAILISCGGNTHQCYSFTYENIALKNPHYVSINTSTICFTNPVGKDVERFIFNSQGLISKFQRVGYFSDSVRFVADFNGCCIESSEGELVGVNVLTNPQVSDSVFVVIHPTTIPNFSSYVEVSIIWDKIDTVKFIDEYVDDDDLLRIRDLLTEKGKTRSLLVVQALKSKDCDYQLIDSVEVEIPGML